MSEPDRAAVREQWGASTDLIAPVRAAVLAEGLAPEALTAHTVAALDQFHPGGMAATVRLADVAGILASAAVLDVGGGLGGPARTLASHSGAVVTVLDMTPAYCHLGRWLGLHTGFAGRVRFVVGDALALPFPDASFDVVWTQASGMNIADKERLAAELARVLRAGGRLVFQELATGRRIPLRFPVPWAREQDLSYLVPPARLRSLLVAAGLRELAWADVSAGILAAMLSPAPTPATRLGVPLLLGPDAVTKLQNLARNLAEGRLAIIQGAFERK